MELQTPYSLSRRVPSATRPPLRAPPSLETHPRVESGRRRPLKAPPRSADYPVQPGSWGNRRGLEEASRPRARPSSPGPPVGALLLRCGDPGGVAERLNATVLKTVGPVT